MNKFHIKDMALARLMAEASNKTRTEEVRATAKMVKRYQEHEEYCRWFFRENKYNPGGWNAITSLVIKAAELQADAEHIETSVMLRHLWLTKGWASPTWAAYHIAKLRAERETGIKYDNDRFKRIDRWKKAGVTWVHSIEQKCLSYIGRRGPYIEREIFVIESLEELGGQLRNGKYPEPNSHSAEVNAALALWYRERMMLSRKTN